MLLEHGFECTRAPMQTGVCIFLFVCCDLVILLSMYYVFVIGFYMHFTFTT